jgi:hypothetical protein
MDDSTRDGRQHRDLTFTTSAVVPIPRVVDIMWTICTSSGVVGGDVAAVSSDIADKSVPEVDSDERHSLALDEF